jgi:hypothetical protein
MTRVSKLVRRLLLGWLVSTIILGIVVFAITRDEPEPDLSDLVVEHRFVPEAENGFVALALAEHPPFWPPAASDVRDAAKRVYDENDLPPAEDEDDPEGSFVNLTEDLEKRLAWRGPAFDPKLVERTLSENRAFFERLVRALRAPGFQVPEAIRFDEGPFVQTYGIDLRHVGNLQGCRVRWHLDRGDVDLAFDAARETVELARRIQHADVTAANFWVGIWLEEQGLRQFRLALGRAEPTEERMKAFLAGIADDDGSAVRDLQRSLRIEGRSLCRWIDEDLLRDNGIGKTSWWMRAIDVHPNQTKRLFAEELRSTIERAELPPWDRRNGRDELEARREALTQGRIKNLMGRNAVACISPAFDGLPQMKDLLLVSRRATRIAAAIRLHIEREGQTPRTLEDLAKSGLPQVPLDPFSGEAFHYDPEGGILFSVGNDFVEQGGSKAVDKDMDPAEPTFTMPRAGSRQGVPPRD